MKPLVVTLRHNKIESFPSHVESFRSLAGPRDSYYWVVIDNGSNDGVENWIEDHKKDFDHVVHLPVNIGPDHGMNRGLIEREDGQTVYAVATDELILGPHDFISYTEKHMQESPAATYGVIPSNTPIIIMSPEFQEVFGYFNEATLGYDIDLAKRHFLINEKTGELPVQVLRRIKTPSASYQRAIRKVIRRYVDMAKKYDSFFNSGGNAYRSSISDKESLERYNPVVDTKTYEEISIENLQFFNTETPDVSLTLEEIQNLAAEDSIKKDVENNIQYSNFGQSILNAPGNPWVKGIKKLL